MMLALFWGFVADRTDRGRGVTTLLCGLLVAGIMRRMMGAEGTRRLFGGPAGTGCCAPGPLALSCRSARLASSRLPAKCAAQASRAARYWPSSWPRRTSIPCRCCTA